MEDSETKIMSLDAEENEDMVYNKTDDEELKRCYE